MSSSFRSFILAALLLPTAQANPPSIPAGQPGTAPQEDAVNLPALSDAITTKDILTAMERVGDWQLAHPSRHKTTDWTQGAGYAGMMALANLSADRKYRDAMVQMGEGNQWKLGPRRYHADDHCVGQTYAELFYQLRDPKMIAPMRADFDDILANPREGSLDFKTKGNQNRWSWCDALFMAPPAWLRLYVATGDSRYLDLAVNHWWRTSDFLYDKKEHLYFRDSNYFAKREANGKNVYWGRGNGWVMGGLVRMLQYLPTNHPSRPRFEQQFKEMSAKLLTCQQADGLWRASLLDPASYPLKETSGSGFYTYAFAWGINQGLLDRARFTPAVRKAWSALVSCVQNDGKLTHVQPIGEDPRKFPDNSTEIYGVGAFLLAGSEVHRMAALDAVKPRSVTVSNPADFSRMTETVELDWAKGNAASVVMDHGSSRILPSQVIGNRLIFQVDLAPKESRRYLIIPATRFAAIPPVDPKTFCRFVPERLDDFAWESDRIAHRMYGPAIIVDPKEKLVSSGVDVWVKSARYPVIDKWYKSGDYHADRGEGLDYYKVGPARGCGGTGIWAGGKLHPSRNFKTWKVLANGPIRSVFELGFEEWDAAGRKVTETKRISIDAGSNFSRVESSFSSNSKAPLAVAIGIVKRPGDAKLAKDPKSGTLSYWEPEMPPNGHTACAAIVSKGSVEFAEDETNHYIIGTATPGKTFVYYIGAGWSKSGDFPNAATWEAALQTKAKQMKQPLLAN
jgi:unsaturated rhamnogalacturonyl hydrolase